MLNEQRDKMVHRPALTTGKADIQLNISRHQGNSNKVKNLKDNNSLLHRNIFLQPNHKIS